MTSLKSSLRHYTIQMFSVSLLNQRVTDIRRCYELWSSRGAKFITEPKVHATELRCYTRSRTKPVKIRGENCMEANVRVISSIANTIETTVIIEATMPPRMTCAT